MAPDEGIFDEIQDTAYFLFGYDDGLDDGEDEDDDGPGQWLVDPSLLPDRS